MKTLELQLRRARLCHIASTVLFVLFCLCGSGGWAEIRNPWLTGLLRTGGFLSGIFAWSLMCTAYDLRRKAF